MLRRNIAPGTDQSLKVTGICSIPTDLVVVRGRLSIEENTLLDASSPTTTLIVSGGVVAEHNGIFILGCSPAFGCATTTHDRISGGVRADKPLRSFSTATPYVAGSRLRAAVAA